MPTTEDPRQTLFTALLYFILHSKTAISLVQYALYPSLIYAQNYSWRKAEVADGLKTSRALWMNNLIYNSTTTTRYVIGRTKKKVEAACSCLNFPHSQNKTTSSIIQQQLVSTFALLPGSSVHWLVEIKKPQTSIFCSCEEPAEEASAIHNQIIMSDI